MWNLQRQRRCSAFRFPSEQLDRERKVGAGEFVFHSIICGVLLFISRCGGVSGTPVRPAARLLPTMVVTFVTKSAIIDFKESRVSG